MIWDDVLRALHRGARIFPRTKRNGQPTDAMLSTGELVTRATTAKLLREGLVDYCGRNSDHLKISSKGVLFVRHEIGISPPSEGKGGIRVGATIAIKANGAICRDMKIVEIKNGMVSFSKGGGRARWCLPLTYVKENIVKPNAGECSGGRA